LLAGGCRSTSSGVNNPFFAPDRVSPPSTRVIAPGQAQPYYQGDPLPVMQSAAPPLASSPLAADSAARSASGQTLAWNPASATKPPGAPAAVASATAPWDANSQTASPIARANEQPIAVPADTSTLRFALPAPTAPQSTSPAMASAPTSSVQSTPLAFPTSNQGMALASYNAPAANTLSPVPTLPTLSPTPQAASPWRTPQVSSSTAVVPPGYTQQPSLIASSNPQPNTMAGTPMYAPAQAPVALPTNQMAVELRAVPSPPQPGDPAPRIRIPGYDVPETASADGFRARTSMR
jgi:hypothetical protein